jgi:hypothetical protein
MTKITKSEDWATLYCDSVEEMRDAIVDKEFVWPLIARGIRFLIDAQRTSCMILEARLTDGRETVWISISEGDVIATIGKMIEWRLSREEYEECSVAKRLLDDWNLRGTSSSSQEVLSSPQLEG